MCDDAVMLRGTQNVECLLFDVGGSVFDWETAIVDAVAKLSSSSFNDADSQVFAATWRRRSMVRMYDVAADRVSWRPFDDFADDALTDALDEHALGPLSSADRTELHRAWRTMPAWPEIRPSLERLRTRHVVAPHSVLSLAAVAQSSKFSGLTWDAIVSCDALGVTKTNPQSYVRAAETVGFDPEQICYVAAHASDLNVAQTLGFRTAYVQSRLDEYGEVPVNSDTVAAFDVVADDYADLADQLV